MVADVDFPIINKLYIYGTLELQNEVSPNSSVYNNFTLSAEHIIIIGGRLIIGTEREPFSGHVDIILRGNHYTEELFLEGGVLVGAKAIGRSGLKVNEVWLGIRELTGSGKELK